MAVALLACGGDASMAQLKYALLESAAGYALFERKEGDELSSKLTEVQTLVSDFTRFARVMSLVSFLPFKTAEEALENALAVAEGSLSGALQAFLQANLPAKAKKVTMGVSAHGLGGVIQETLGISCACNEYTAELLRGLRVHLHRFVPAMRPGDLERAQLGLAHSYSRSKVKFDVNRADKHIIQSIAILDTLDKDINTFAMRVREWYSWHFPELVKIVPDNYMYARCLLLIQKRESLTDESKAQIEAILMDEAKAQAVLDAARHSMGMDIKDVDLQNVHTFAERIIKLAEYRVALQEYLRTKMELVAPNLQALIGDQVAARLISHAGSLTSLAKYPASTVQILGAEKALFRALKTRGNTPKYGLIFHSTFISRAAAKNKGRISRYLANKCSIAARIDSFSELPTSKFGEKLREQVEERLRFYDSGEAPRKNLDVMHEAMADVRAELEAAGKGGSGKAAAASDGEAKAGKKRKAEKAEGEEGEKKKKKKKDKEGGEDEGKEEKKKKKKKEKE